jgi:hypothetical protein
VDDLSSVTDGCNRLLPVTSRRTTTRTFRSSASRASTTLAVVAGCPVHEQTAAAGDYKWFAYSGGLVDLAKIDTFFILFLLSTLFFWFIFDGLSYSKKIKNYYIFCYDLFYYYIKFKHNL